MFKTICVDHVGIACKDLDLSKKFYTEVLGLSCTGEEAVPELHYNPYNKEHRIKRHLKYGIPRGET